VARSDDRYLNHAHANANLAFQLADWNGLRPYLTGGVGTFMGQAVERGTVGDADVSVNGRAMHPATNLGAGVRYWVTDWLGLTADYRQFQVYADQTRHVNRFAAGLTFGVK
jgi:opacity protein-like surface antigen